MPGPSRTLVLSLDVGSTTVKIVVVDATSRTILWSDYQRHETRQAEKALELLFAAEAALPELASGTTVAAVTGSGARRFVKPVGARFVQEVNAVTLAVEALYPDAGSVVELGGQDAKIIVFSCDPATGQKRAASSMNDKCASGTMIPEDASLDELIFAPDDAQYDAAFGPALRVLDDPPSGQFDHGAQQAADAMQRAPGSVVCADNERVDSGIDFRGPLTALVIVAADPAAGD